MNTVNVSDLTTPRSFDESLPSLAFLEPDSINVFVSRQRLADVPNGKVLLVGLQKSGNTWLHGLLADTLNYPYLFELDEVQGRGVLSTHLPFCDKLKFRHDFVHAVCVIRDLRDVVLSYFHYMNSPDYQTQIPYAHYDDINTFYYDWFLSRLVPAQRFQTYWAEYAERGVPIIRYERMLTNTTEEIVRLFARWAEPVDIRKIELAVEANSLERLKAGGKQMGLVSVHASHFRHGKAGRYRDELPPHIVKDIERRFGETLARWGYL